MATESAPNSEEKSEEKTPQEIQTERYELVKTIVGKETFIDPLDADQMTRSYGIFENNPDKIVEVLAQSFTQYCRKCIREAALLEVKNELSYLSFEEAEKLGSSTVESWYEKVRNDPALEQLLVMLIFKTYYWEWTRFGLKEIFTAQRMQPGHEINSYLNARFHKLKQQKKFRNVGDLVNLDITEIINSFKGLVMGKKIKLFEN